jgi:uncharacterized protein
MDTRTPRRTTLLPAPTPSPRIASLDVLRGVAILGTLATNIWIFTDPAGFLGYLVDDTATTTPAGWAWVEAVLQQLSQGKFLGLLTLMFGIGLEIQRRSALRAGRRWPGRYPVRAALLFLDGVLHYLLVVEFDVLMGYAVTGAVVAYLLATSERAQRTWMVAAAGVHVLLLGLVTAALTAASTPPVPGVIEPNPYADGSWWDLVLLRVDDAALFRLEPVFIQALSVAVFLLGARLLRAGALTPEGAGLRRRLLLVGAVALPVDLGLGVFGGPAGLLLSRYGTAPLVALGLLALVVEVVGRRERLGAPGRHLAEVGRMALSSYVLQNVVASALCYGWGLGLASRLDPGVRVPATIAVYLAVVTVVVAFAHLWLRRFDRGPVEWLWNSSYRALTGGR